VAAVAAVARLVAAAVAAVVGLVTAAVVGLVTARVRPATADANGVPMAAIMYVLALPLEKKLLPQPVHVPVDSGKE
jgi:hypothetical protein